MRTELLELLVRRAGVLDQVAEGPIPTRALVGTLDCSRTTVNRALRELQEEDLVERTDEGYATTPAGDLALASLRRHADRVDAALAAAPVLEPLPDTAGLPPRAVAGATVDPDGGVAEPLRSAAPLAGWLAVPDADLLAALAGLPDRAGSLPARPEGASTSVVLAPGGADALARTAPSTLVAAAAAPDTELLVGSTPAFSLLAADSDPGRDAGPDAESPARPDGDFTADADPAGGPDAASDAVTTTGPTNSGAVERPAPLVVVHDGDAVHGTLEPAADDWARAAVARRRSGAARVDAALASQEGAAADALRVWLRDAAPGAFEAAPPLPAVLARQGFQRLTASYFEREPAPAAAALRSGLTPLEVHHGYAIERRVDGDPLAARLVDRLADGEDCALVGPPGAGKSTTCMRAAVDWHDRGLGPVIYRAADAGTAVGDPELLAAYLRATDGHALLVVEDGPRPEVRAVLDVVDACADRADVSVLLDARRREWRELLPVDGAADIAEVGMPSLDGAAARRLVDRVETLTGVDVDSDPDALLDAVADGDPDGAGPAPGAMYLLKHWLALRAADAATATPESALTADVERVHDLAAAGPPLAPAVAVLVNLLNLAGLAVRRELVYGLAVALADREDGPAVEDPADAAAAALAALAGECVFGPDVAARDPGRLRTPHETWSTAFLAALPDREGSAAARERFGRVLSGLLSLADVPDRRDRVAAALGGHGPHLERLAAAPGDWADDTVEALFTVPTDRGQLAPLYGHTDEGIDPLPAACSPALGVRVAAWRGEAYDRQGDTEAAGREFELVLERADEVADDSLRERLRAEAERRLAGHARDRGELDRAEALLERALDRYRELGDPAGRGKVQRGLGIVNAVRRSFEAAERHFEAALETHRAAGNRTGLANAYSDRGLLAKKRGDTDLAADCFEAARELLTAVGDPRRQAVATMNLGTIALSRDDYDEARRLLGRALGLYREAGDEQGVVSVLTNLGSVALRTSDLATAIDRLEQALERSRDLGDTDGEAAALRNLGEVARRRGRFQAAAVRFDAARQAVDDADDRPGLRLMEARLARDRGDDDRAAELFRSVADAHEGRAPRNLAELARRRGDLDAAEVHLQRSLDYYRDADDTPRLALALTTRARVAMDRGDLDGAAAPLREAREYCDPDDPSRRPDIVVATALGRLARRRGDDEQAVEWLEPAAAAARDAEEVLLALRAADPLAEALAAVGRSDDAVEWCNAAAELAADAGRHRRARRFHERATALAGG